MVWVSLNPQAGHEQAGRRPALVVSPRTYNGKVGLAVLCPGRLAIAAEMLHLCREAFAPRHAGELPRPT